MLRVPGFLHRKDRNNPHLVRIVASPGWRYPRQQIIEAFPPVVEQKAPQQAKKTDDGKVLPKGPHISERDDNEDRRIRDALFSIDATERHVWLTIGMAIEAHYGGAGRSCGMNGRSRRKTNTTSAIRTGPGGHSTDRTRGLT